MERTLALPNDDPTRDELDDGIVADALIPDLHLIPGFWKIDGYTSPSWTPFRRTSSCAPGENFFQFPYDWRRDNRVAARKLAKNRHTLWLTAWRQSSGNANAKLILIAHSMVGSREPLPRVLEGWRDSRAHQFGTPYRGSIKRSACSSTAEDKGFDLTDVSRSMTAPDQLLPIYKCYDGGNGRPSASARQRMPNVDAARPPRPWPSTRRSGTRSRRTRRLPHYLNARLPHFPGGRDLAATNLSARRWRQRRARYCSPTRATRSAATAPCRACRRSPSRCPTRPGDDLFGERHGSLQNADAVLAHLMGVLSGLDLDLGDFRKPKNRCSRSEVEDLYIVGEAVSVRARPRNDVALAATFRRSGENAPLAHPRHDAGRE